VVSTHSIYRFRFLLLLRRRRRRLWPARLDALCEPAVCFELVGFGAVDFAGGRRL